MMPEGGDRDAREHQARLDGRVRAPAREDLLQRVVRVGEHRVQEVLEPVGRPMSCRGARECRARPARIEPTARTCRGTIMVAGDSCTWCSTSWPAAEAPAEGHEVEAEHVEGGHGRGHEARWPRPAAVAADLEGRPEDLVLGEEAGEGRDAGDGEAAHEHRPVGAWASCALSPPILRMSCSPDMPWMTRARAEEEQRLEEGVGHQVEDAGGEGAHPAAQEHVAELADRRVGQHALDVVLHEADGGGEERGERADDRDHGERRRARARRGRDERATM